MSPLAVRITARAKLNLGLAVGPRRADGFHDLATVFQSVTLADTLEIERRPRGYRLEVRFEDATARGSRAAVDADVPRGGDNLVLRAARLAAAELGLPGGAAFRLTKRIPSRAGLGGGSADAAAALVGLARLHGVGLSRARRIALGLRLGADVPFAATGGTAWGLGRGEILRPLRLARSLRVVIAVPEWGVSTASAFRAIARGKYGLTVWKAKLRSGQSLGREAVTAERALRLGNTFESVLGRRRSDFDSLCTRMRSVGIREPRLTGSGSAVFGILETGLSVRSVVTRFQGTERLFTARSARAGLRVTTLR